MGCSNCCNCRRVKADEITVEPGIISVIVPDDVIFEDGREYCICLFKNIPVADNCSQVIIQNASGKFLVYNGIANYWRPEKLSCRSILKLQFFDDPEHFQIICVKK